MDVVTCNKLYRRDFLDRHGLRFETSFRSMEDDVLWLMVLAHATCLAVIPDRLYWYRRQRHGSVSQMLEAQERPLLLVAEPVKLGPCARLHSTLMSACSGRKGRYHRLKLLLSGLS